ncbi:Paired domain-containing protein [Caenorhabditis elegans]|uniref:Paired domain-containing protein n=1 Tax=Caenorhabditis elegans TaxID=6239 RepID=H9G2Q0_CAEEL|nr:Paired domain-containing protein [Caenorhabditis elegans]CCG28279.1 Paired domain-containing protein [Caenorhabditis elegans]|eukprot:NP_001255345.1 N-terminal PAX (PAI domain only) protein [Caenorhabditis elegans]
MSQHPHVSSISQSRHHIQHLKFELSTFKCPMTFTLEISQRF